MHQTHQTRHQVTLARLSVLCLTAVHLSLLSLCRVRLCDLPCVGMSGAARSLRLVVLLSLALTCGLVALVAHTNALAARHARVAHLFDTGGGERTATLAVTPVPVIAASPPPARDFAALCAPDAATGAVGVPQSELWGDVVVSAERHAHDAPNARACCLACAAFRDCNVWVHCSEPARCGQQCWLKRLGSASALAVPHAAGAGVPWTSGTLPGKALDVSPAALPPADEGISTIALRTSHGDIRLRLRPDWSLESVAYVRTLAAQPELCSSACEFYRVEPGFLLQGSLRARFAPNSVTRPGPRIMTRGDCGWAGGSAGPDFFCYLGAQPATHWGRDHTVWAEVADDASFAVAEAINALPPRPTPPGEMHILAQRVPIDVAVVQRGA